MANEPEDELAQLAAKLIVEGETGDMGLIRRIDRETGEASWELLPYTEAQSVFSQIRTKEPNVGRAKLRRMVMPPESPGGNKWRPKCAKAAMWYAHELKQRMGIYGPKTI